MKLNWGGGIALFYSLFVVGMVSLVVASSRRDIGLVAKNYYDADLNAQKIHDERQNAAAENLRVENRPDRNRLEFHFPKTLAGQPSGEIRFLRPSDARLDFSQNLVFDSLNVAAISTTKMKPGLWRVTVSWQADGRDFLKELPIHL